MWLRQKATDTPRECLHPQQPLGSLPYLLHNGVDTVNDPCQCYEVPEQLCLARQNSSLEVKPGNNASQLLCLHVSGAQQWVSWTPKGEDCPFRVLRCHSHLPLVPCRPGLKQEREIALWKTKTGIRAMGLLLAGVWIWLDLQLTKRSFISGSLQGQLLFCRV